ncbi:MAG: redoxin family protein, partial [Planctomycetota bacterium]
LSTAAILAAAGSAFAYDSAEEMFDVELTGGPAEAERAFAKVVETHRGLESLEQRAFSEYTYDGLFEDQTLNTFFVYERGEGFAIEIGDNEMHLVRHHGMVIVASSDLKQYAQAEYRDIKDDVLGWAEEVADQPISTPIASNILLASSANPEDIFDEGIEFVGTADGLIAMEMTHDELSYPVRFAVDGGMLTFTAIDLSAQAEEMGIENSEFWGFGRVESVADSKAHDHGDFEFDAEGLYRVPQLTDDVRGKLRELQEELDGSGEAPVWEARTLNGDRIALEDFRGKVVLMDFWATWCPPCVRALPEIQAIHEMYDEDDVVVLGMNQRENGQTVDDYVSDKGFTFTQVMDRDGSIGDKYGVEGIPSTAVVDPAGNLTYFHTGYSPGMKQDLIDAIEEARLVDPDQPADRRPGTEILDDIEAYRTILDAQRVASGEYAGVNSRKFGRIQNVEGAFGEAQRFDADGDGVLDLFFIDGESIVAINGATGGVRNMELPRLPRNDGVMGFALIDLNGESGFLLSLDEYDDTFDTQHLVVVSEDGVQWQTEIEAGNNVSVDAYVGTGDLDGDGVDEVLVGVEMWDEDFNYSYGLDIVDGRTGQLVSRREVELGVFKFETIRNESGPDTVLMLGNGQVFRLEE